MSKSVRVAILTGSIWTVAAMTSRAAIVMQQNFDTDPVNYTASPFVQQGTGLDTTSKYWDLANNVPATIRNPNLVGNTTNYLTGQNMDAPLPFSTTAPAQVDFEFAVGTATGLTLSVDLAGLPSAEVENYVRAFADTDGDLTYETAIFNFVGNNNSAYIDAATGQILSGTFQTFSNFSLPNPTAVDGKLRIRFEVFDDTDSQNEAIGLDNVLVEGSTGGVGRNLVYNRNHAVGGAPNGALQTSGNYFLDGATPTAFVTNDVVNFSQDGSATINVPADVTTGGIVVSNTTGTYTIGGLGKIRGPFTKSNAGSVIFTSANNFTSSTISGGTVETQAGALGSGAVLLSGGALWKVTTAAQTQNGAVGAGTGGGTIQTDFDLTAGGVNGDGKLTKTGPGTLTLTGGGNGLGGIDIVAGKLSLKNAVGGATETITMNGNLLEFSNTGEITFSDATNTRVINLGPAANTISVLTAGAGAIISAPNGLLSGGTITKIGDGALRMDGDQSALTSDWIVNAGTLEARVGNPLGSGKVTVNAGARLAGRDTPVANAVILAGGDLATRTGDNTDFTGGVTVTAASTVTMHSYTTPANAQNITISSVLSGTGDLTLNGNIVADPTLAKALILTNPNNTYAGTLIVTDGQTLQLEGNLTSTASQASVTGTLSGRGTIAGKVTANALGTIAPGPGPGILSIGGNVVMSPTSILSLELAHGVDPTPVAGTDYDQVKIGTGAGAVSTGTVSLDGAELRLTLNSTVPANDLFFIVLNDGVDPITGTFLNTPDDSVIDVGGQGFRISYDANSTTGLLSGGNDIALVAIPEPTSAALLFLAGGLLLRRRTR